MLIASSSPASPAVLRPWVDPGSISARPSTTIGAAIRPRAEDVDGAAEAMPGVRSCPRWPLKNSRILVAELYRIPAAINTSSALRASKPATANAPRQAPHHDGRPPSAAPPRAPLRRRSAGAWCARQSWSRRGRLPSAPGQAAAAGADSRQGAGEKAGEEGQPTAKSTTRPSGGPRPRAAADRPAAGGGAQTQICDHQTDGPADGSRRPPSAGAETRARDRRPARLDREFLAPRKRPREQQIADIGAGDQQHQRDRGEEHDDRPPNVADDHSCRGMAVAPQPAFSFGYAARGLFDASSSALRLATSSQGQAGDDLGVVVLADHPGLGVVGERHPEVAASRAPRSMVNPGGMTPTMCTPPHRASAFARARHRCRRTALPESMAENHDVVAAGGVSSGMKIRPSAGWALNDVEKVLRPPRRRRCLRFAAAGERRAIGSDRSPCGSKARASRCQS